MRILVALAAGLVIGVVLIEAVSAGLAFLLPASALFVEPPDGYAPAVIWPLLPIPAIVWMTGAFAAGAMAAAAGPHSAWGLAAGVLLAVPVFVLVGLVTPGNPMAFLAAAVPLAGSAGGVLVVVRLSREQTHEEVTVSANGQAV